MLPNPLRSSHPIWLLLGLLALVTGLWMVFWPPALANVATRYALGGPMIGLGSALAAIQIALWRKTDFEHAMAPGEANA